MMTANVYPDVCPMCGYLTPNPQPCYLCWSVVAETLPRFSSSLAGSTDITFAAAG
jgi:hypothetical protein